MKQKLLALSLSLALCLSLLPAALAAGKTYDQAVKELQEHDSQLTFKQSFETEYGTVFVCDSPNPHANTGWLRFVTKALCAKGEGEVVGLPHPRHSIWCNTKPPLTAQLSDDKTTFTYTYHYDEPLINGLGPMLRPAGDFIYTLDLTTGEVTENVPAIPEDYNTYSAALELEPPITEPTETPAPTQQPGSLNSQAEKLANKLKTLGLFLGDEHGNFNLDKAPTRVEALVMLIRALGEEPQAKAAGKTHPFTDVPAWADGYVSWGYAKGYTKGVSASEFGTESTASCEMYLTFLLRALGYTEGAGADFTYDRPFLLAYDAGVFLPCIDFTDFRRSDVVEATVAALFAFEKGGFSILHERLAKAGAFTQAQFDAAFPVNPFLEVRQVQTAVDQAMSEYWAEVQPENSTAVRTHTTILLDYDYSAAAQAYTVLVLSLMVGQELVDGQVQTPLASALNAYSVQLSSDLKLQYATSFSTLWGQDWKNLIGRYNKLFSEEELQAHAKAKAKFPTSTPQPETHGSYSQAVAELRSGLGHSNEQTFETDDCTVFVFDRGGFMNAPSGAIQIIYKAGSLLGDGYVLDPPHVRSGWHITPADSMDYDPEKETFTYSYFFDTTAYDSSIQSYDTRVEPGTFTFTVDLPTGEVYRDYRPVDYAGAMAHVTRKRNSASDKNQEVVKTLESDLCTAVLTKGRYLDQYDDYILSLVYKPGSPLGEGTIKQLLLPSTIYADGYTYHPTDRSPDSLELSPDGRTLTYVYHFDEALMSFHEAGTYTYTVDLATGELSVVHTAD